MVLLQGENADGATVDEKEFAVTAADDSPTVSASDRAIAAILGTREDAVGAGIELSAVGVACTDQLEATAVRDALAAHKLENVMLVSTFLAATSLTQSVGGAMGYERTAVLFVEPDTATLAVVETADGSVADVQKESLVSASGECATAKLMEMVAGLVEMPDGPDGLFVVGAGVDVAPIKPWLEEATPLSVSTPEEPETALARGAALASANAPLFASSTAALAYAQDPGTGALDASTLPEYLRIADTETGDDEFAYSAVEDDEASAPTVVMDAGDQESEPRSRPGLLVGSAVAVAAISAAMALEIALSVGVHTTVGMLPAPLQNLLAPAEHVFAPAPWQVAATKAEAPKPLSPPAGAPPAAPVPAAAVPAAPVPAAPVPIPAAPVPEAQVPAAPIPVVVVPPIAPRPVPPVWFSDPPASPPVIQAPPHPSPPAEPPRVHVAPPHSPPPHQTPPAQGPGAGQGGTEDRPPTNPGGGPVNGPGPGHGNPVGEPPEGGGPGTGPGAPGDTPPEGGPVTGPAPSHGTPGGAPPEGGPVGGGTPPGGGPIGGVGSPGSSGPVGGVGSPGSSGPVGGGGSPVGGGSSIGGGSSGGGGHHH
jgi:hypothetical protein